MSVFFLFLNVFCLSSQVKILSLLLIHNIIIVNKFSTPSRQSIVLSSEAFLRHLSIYIEILLTWNWPMRTAFSGGKYLWPSTCDIILYCFLTANFLKAVRSQFTWSYLAKVFSLANHVVILSHCSAIFTALVTGPSTFIMWNSAFCARKRELTSPSPAPTDISLLAVDCTISFLSKTKENVDAYTQLSWHLTHCWFLCCCFF